MKRLAAALVGVLISLASCEPAYASTLDNTATKCGQTNGEVNAMAISGTKLAIGGSFTSPGKNFAVISTTTCKTLYAGNVASTVRSMATANGQFYVGGDFGAIGIKVADYTRSAWKPSTSGKVMAISANTVSVYLGTPNEVRSTQPGSGATKWSKAVTGGPVRSLLWVSATGWLYVGGLFETVGGLRQHGLVALNSSGTPQPQFRVLLPADSGIGTQGDYDGEAPLGLCWDGNHRRVVMVNGSASQNYIRAVNDLTGSGAGMEHTHHKLIGDGQACSVPGDGNAYFAGYHNGHPNGWPGVEPMPHFAAMFDANSSAILPWDGKLTGAMISSSNGGVKATAYSNGKLYVGGNFRYPFNSIAVFEVR